MFFVRFLSVNFPFLCNFFPQKFSMLSLSTGISTEGKLVEFKPENPCFVFGFDKKAFLFAFFKIQAFPLFLHGVYGWRTGGGEFPDLPLSGDLMVSFRHSRGKGRCQSLGNGSAQQHKLTSFRPPNGGSEKRGPGWGHPRQLRTLWPLRPLPVCLCAFAPTPHN